MVKATVIEPYFDIKESRIRQVGEEVEIDDNALRILTGENVFGKAFVFPCCGKEEEENKGIKHSNKSTQSLNKNRGKYNGRK